MYIVPLEILERLLKIFGHVKPGAGHPAQRPLSGRLPGFNRFSSHDGLIALSNNDFLAGECLADELRKMGFRLVNGRLRHTSEIS